MLSLAKEQTPPAPILSTAPTHWKQILLLQAQPSQGGVLQAREPFFQTAMISSDPNPIFLVRVLSQQHPAKPKCGVWWDSSRCVHHPSHAPGSCSGHSGEDLGILHGFHGSVQHCSAFQGSAKASSLHSQHVLPGRRCHSIVQPCSFCRDFLVLKENSLLQACRAGKSSSF